MLYKMYVFPQTRAVFPLVNKQLQDVKGVELKTASKIYIPETYELDETFATDIKSVFDSDVKKVDFAKNTEAASEINAWVCHVMFNLNYRKAILYGGLDYKTQTNWN